MAEVKENMATNEEQPKLEFKPASIDADILDIMKQEDFVKSLEDPKLMKRYMLNFMAENLSLMHQLEKLTETLVNVLTMTYSKPLAEYYNKAEENVEAEKKVLKTKEIIKKSHLKAKK